MTLKDSGLAGIEGTLGELDHILHGLDFYRWAWDYQHATYDMKIKDKEDWYYLRLQAHAIAGKLDDADCVLKLDDPFLGKATFPHGCDYDANIPDAVMKHAKAKIQAAKEKLTSR